MKRIILLLFLTSLFALPRFAVEEGSRCINCHVNPSGSGMRNDYGYGVYTLDELTIRKWISKGNEDWDGYVTDYIQIGGEFRMQSFNTENDARLFPMQAELYTKIDINKSADLYFETSLDGSNYEYFVLFNDLPKKGWVKLGKSSPTYGLMIDDHTSFIKSGNGTQLDSDNRNLDIGFRDLFNPMDSKPIMIEGSTSLLENMYLTMSASTSLLGVDTENFDNYSATLTYNGKINSIPYMIGSSIMRENDLDLRGVFGGFYFNNTTVTFESDWAKNLLDYIDESFACYAQIAYKPYQGMNFILKYDYFDHNYNYMTDSMTRTSYGFEVFPLNFLELKVQIRTHTSESFDFENEYLIQVHTWF